jgi:hypothetical protein
MSKSAATALVHALASTTERRKPVRLSGKQVEWLEDTRPYFNLYRDRTAAALIRKGVIKVTEQDYSGSGRAGYEITPIGREALVSLQHPREP